MKAENYLYEINPPDLKKGLAEQSKMEVMLKLYKRDCREEIEKLMGKKDKSNKKITVIE